MTSDFGADIFDKDDAPPPPSEPTQREAKPAKSQEVKLPRRSGGRSRKKDTDEVSFEEAAPKVDAAVEQPAEAEPKESTEPSEEAERPARSRRSRRGEGRRRRGGDGDEAEKETTSDPVTEEVAEASEEPAEDRAPRGRRERRSDADEDDRPSRSRRRRRRDGPGDEADADNSDAPRRGRGRGRRRDDRPRDGEGERQQAPSRGAAPATQRIAIFIDAAALQEQASDQGAQVSFLRMLRDITGNRSVIRSVAYVVEGDDSLDGALAGHDIDVESCEDVGAVGVALAVDAVAIAPKVDCVIVASGSRSLAPLARSLRGQGIRVESASFESERPWQGQVHHALGRSCLFVP